MKNKHKKKMLDEMQEQNLLKLEETGLWIVFWSLLVAIIVQFIIKPDIKLIAGEAVILVIASIYIVVSSIKKGLWSKTITPTRKSNAVGSLIPTLLLGIVHIIRTFVILRKAVTLETTATICIRIAAVYILCFIVLEVLRTAYQKKRENLDNTESEA